MELRHLRYFVAVAEELNFTRAAERLGIKQPPLSQQIRKLEKELGAPLFRRLARTVELTAAGKLLLEEARGILEHVEHVTTDVRRRGRGETGSILIGTAGATYFDPVVNAITREFCKIYPDVVIRSEENSSQTLLAGVRAGRLDAVFVWCQTDDSKFAVAEVANEDLMIMLPDNHVLAGRKSLPLSALAKEQFILFARRMNNPLHDTIISACRRTGFEPILGREYPHVFAIYPLVAAGLGISIVPRCLTRVHVQGVAYRPIAGQKLHAPISLVHRRNDQSTAVRNLTLLARRIIRAQAKQAGEAAPRSKTAKASAQP